MRKNILILGHNDATQFVDIYNQYTRLFDPEKYAVTVAYLTGKAKTETKQRILAEQVICLNLPKPAIRGLKIGAIRKLLTLCQEKKFEIVICHRYKPTYIMLWVTQFCHIPILILVMHELNTMTSIARRCLIACLLRKNMLFAGVSNAVRDDLQKSLWRVPKDQIVTLYNVIDVELIEKEFLSREKAREALDLPENMFIFGHIARLVPNKDQATLIRAFSLAKSTCPQVKLIIIGDGILETSLKEQVLTNGLNEEVIFTGYIINALRYMKAFDCFVLPSIQEAFGRVLLEAMLAKVPVIAARTHGIPEVIGETGWLINPKDAETLAKKMKEIYSTPIATRKQYGEKAYQHVISHFSIPAFCQQFWQLNCHANTLKNSCQ